MEQVKSILILSTSNPYKTAGIVAYDIYKGFKEKGYIVKLLVENYDNYIENDIESIQGKYEFYVKKLLAKFKKRLIKFRKKVLSLSDEEDTFPEYHFDNRSTGDQIYCTEKILKKAGFTPDVIIVIFSQYFISFQNLEELQKITKAPIFWQFADMHPFTGGCHYAWECKGYMSLCENCPAFRNKDNQNITNLEMLKKLKHLENIKITPVIGSDWLIKRASKSSLFKNSVIEKIYISLDTNFMVPFSKEKINILREKYNVEKDSFVILILAKYLSHKRKGIDIIIEALQQLDAETITKNKINLFIIGQDFDYIRNKIPNSLKYIHITSVERNELPNIYNVCDLFVSASLQEVGPYTITEALLCEIPVIALDHGYANEFVINNKTGILVKDDKPESLKNAILDIIKIDKDNLEVMKKYCRSRTKEIVSTEQQINQYIKIINKI